MACVQSVQRPQERVARQQRHDTSVAQSRVFRHGLPHGARHTLGWSVKGVGYPGVMTLTLLYARHPVAFVSEVGIWVLVRPLAFPLLVHDSTGVALATLQPKAPHHEHIRTRDKRRRQPHRATQRARSHNGPCWAVQRAMSRELSSLHHTTRHSTDAMRPGPPHLSEPPSSGTIPAGSSTPGVGTRLLGHARSLVVAALALRLAMLLWRRLARPCPTRVLYMKTQFNEVGDTLQPF